MPVLLKGLALASAAISLVSASPGPPTEMRLFVQFQAVHKVSCREGSGTAFKIGKDKLLSVAHVTSLHDCKIDGVPIEAENDGALDYSLIHAPVPGPAIKFSCEGYHSGEWVWSIGYALGGPVQTGLAQFTSYAKDGDGKRILLGPVTVIPGMSGGPILNTRGEAVGLVNAYVPGTSMSFSRDLRDSPICKEA